MCAISAEKLIKNSVVYGFAVTQPLAMYIDAYPMLQEKLLFDVKGLQYGDNSETVLLLQTKLNNLGYYNDEMDGEYGLLTEHAVKTFQSSSNMMINGEANKETIETIVIANQQVETSDLLDIITLLEYGDVSEDVRFIQEKLFYLGLYKGKIDSSYGPLTQLAIDEYYIQTGYVSNIPEQQPADMAKDNNGGNKHAPSDTLEDKELLDITSEKEAEAIKVVSKQTDVLVDSHQAIIKDAEALQGIPYVWGGTTTSGFDCSGFIQYIYQENDITIPRTVNDIWNFSTAVSSPSIGDLVFFETYKSGPSHLGIYIGNGDFIHAGVSNGVTTSNVNDNYWESRYLGAKRIN